MKIAALAWCAAAAICTGGQQQPAPGDFSFEYALHAGYGFRRLSITISGGAAEMIRNEGRIEGAAIGLFRGEVTPDQCERLVRATPDGLRSVPNLARDSAYYSVRLRTRERNVDLRIPQSAFAEVAALMRELSRLETQTVWKPVRAVQVEFAPPTASAAAGKAQEYTVRLRNPGV